MFSKKLAFLLHLTLTVSVLGIETKSDSNYFSFPASENGTCYKTLPYDDVIAARISNGIAKLISGPERAGVKTSNSQQSVTILDCCDGFERNNSTGKCETHCDEGCVGGTCTGPNICTCEDGWQPEAGICKPVCRTRCPKNAYCFSPDVCTCQFGYEEDEGVCYPVCLRGCRNGDCVAPRDCRCHPGYFLNETQHCEPLCEGGCPHGQCSSPGICACDSGYVTPLNNLETCVPRCPDNCINGECYSPDVCTCKSGYERTSNGTCISQCRDECVNGRCVGPDQCECNPGFKIDLQLKRCVLTTNAPGSSDRSVTSGSSTAGRPFVYGNSVQNRNRPTNDQWDVIEYDSQNQTDDIKGVIGLKSANQTNNQQTSFIPQRSSNSQEINFPNRNKNNNSKKPYEDFEVNQTSKPQRLYPSLDDEIKKYEQEGPSPLHKPITQNQQRTSRPYESDENEQTHGVHRSYTSQGYYDHTRRPENFDNTQTRDPQRPYSLQGSHNLQNEGATYRPQGTYSQRPLVPQDQHRSTRPNDDYEGTQTHNPRRPHYSRGPYSSQDEDTTRPPLEVYEHTQTNRPQEASSQRPQAAQDQHRSRRPDEDYEGTQTHNPRRLHYSRGPYSSQDEDSTRSPFEEYERNQPNRPQGASSQRPYTAQDQHRSRRPDEDYEGTQTHNPRRPHYSRGPYSTQDEDTTRPPLEVYDHTQPNRPQEASSQRPQSAQDLHRSRRPDEDYEGTQTHNPRRPHYSRGPYSSQDEDSTRSPFEEYERNQPNRHQGASSQRPYTAQDQHRLTRPNEDYEGIKTHNPRRPYYSRGPYSTQDEDTTRPPFEEYEHNQPNRPQSASSQKPYSTQDQYRSRRPNEDYEGTQTHNPHQPYSSPRPYSSQNQDINGRPHEEKDNQTHRLQGPFPPERPNLTPNRGSTESSYNYNYYEGSRTNHPQSAQHSPPRDYNPYKLYNNNRTRDSQGIYPTYGENRTQNVPRFDERLNNHESDQTENPRPPGVPYGPGQTQDTSRTQHRNYQNGPFAIQGRGQIHDSRYNDGIKTANRRPSTDQLHREPEIDQSHTSTPSIQSQVTSENNRPYAYVGPEQNNGRPSNVLEPPTRNPNIGNGFTEITFGSPPLEGGYLIGLNQFVPICNFPCINGDCIGPDQCACKPGYGSDPFNPFSNICVPICHGGCLNGVCTAPNFCICNLGFIKEHGVKSSQRCIPIY